MLALNITPEEEEMDVPFLKKYRKKEETEAIPLRRKGGGVKGLFHLRS